MNLNQLIEFYNDGNNYNVERLLKLSDQFMLELSLSANSIEDLFVKGNELFFPKIEITGENNLKNTQNVIFAFNHPTTFDIFPISKLFSNKFIETYGKYPQSFGFTPRRLVNQRIY